MIDINFSSVTTTFELADTLDQEFELQTTTFYSELESAFSGMVSDAGMNCGILSSVKSMAKQATGQFLAEVREVSNGVEKAIGELTEGIGDIIKSIRSSIDSAIIKVKEFSDWLRTQLTLPIQRAIDAVNSVISSLNTVIGNAVNTVTQVISSINAIASEMVNVLKNFALRVCSSMTESLEKVGHGAGIDSTVDAATAPNEEFTNKILSGMQGKLTQFNSSLTTLSETTPSGSSQATEIRSSFSSIDELISGL